MSFHKGLIGDDLHIGRSNVGSASPIGVVTPGIIGEFFWDNINNKFYVAKDLTDTGWHNEASGFNTLAEILAGGNNTGGNDILFNTGDKITAETGLIFEGTFAVFETAGFSTWANILELSDELSTDASADGAGIQIRGLSIKSISYNAAQNSFRHNLTSIFEKEMSIGSLLLPATDSSLDLKATDKAMVLNRMPTTTRDGLTPLAGMVIYDTTTNQEEFYNGTVWVNKGGSGGDVVGPAIALDDELVRFDGATGKVIKAGSGIDAQGAGYTGFGTGSLDADSMIEMLSPSNDGLKIKSPTAARLYLHDTSAGANLKQYNLVSSGGIFRLFQSNDDLATGFSNFAVVENKVNMGPNLVTDGETPDSDADVQVTNDTPSTLKIKSDVSARLALHDTTGGIDLKQINLENADGLLKFVRLDDDLAGREDLAAINFATKNFFSTGQFHHHNSQSLEKQVATLSDEVVEVWQESDFGTAVSSVITLVAGTSYHIMDSFTLTSQLLIPTGGSVQIRTPNRSHVVTYTNLTLALFKGTNIGTLALFDCVFDGNSTGILLDIDGGVLSFKFPDFNSWGDLGDVANLVDFFGPGMFIDTVTGLTLTDCASTTIYGTLVLISNPGSSAFVINGASSGDLQFYNNILEGGATNNLFNIQASYPLGQTVNVGGNNIVSGNMWTPPSADQTDLRVISRGNKGAPDSRINADVGALDEGGTQTLLDQNQVQRIVATFIEISAERMSTDAAGNAEYVGLEDITLSILSTITGTNSFGTNINMNFYVVKGNSLNTVTSFTDAGGGLTTVNTSLPHGYTTNDRIVIWDEVVYDGEYAITVTGASTFTIPVVHSTSGPGSHAKVQINTKASNVFSGANANTTVVAQIPVVTNDFLFLAVENTTSTAEWETEDIHELYTQA